MPDLPPFPEVIDSSIRSSFTSCLRQGYYAHILNLRKPTVNLHLHFGGCIAKGLETTRKAYWQDGLDELNAIALGMKAIVTQWGDFEIPPEIENSRAGVKDLAGALDALASYFEHHQLGNDVIRPLFVGIPREAMIEKSFALLIPGTRHPVTGEPIIYAGRFDMLGEFQDAVFVVDEKTTLQLGNSWRSNWTLRGQLSGYCWGARTFLDDANIAGCIIRGIGIMKGNITFEQAIVSRPEWQVEQWLRQLTMDVNRWIEHWTAMAGLFGEGIDDIEGLHHHEFWDQALDSACSAFGGCGYVELCDSPDPRNWYNNYIVKPWDPLQREGDAT